ncbi:MAG: tyrosine-type recombinase/integrase [Pseudomonadota bacterium]
MRQINADALTFKVIAEEWIEKKRSRWAPYYLMQVERGMKKDIYPRIGRLPIRSVTAADVLAILDRATKRGAEVVALNLLQWCSQVFRYVVATLRADHDPASALRGAVICSRWLNVGWIESGTSWPCARRITGRRTMAVDECR